jgi:MFS family permease
VVGERALTVRRTALALGLIAIAAILILWATTFVSVPDCPYDVTENPVDCSDPEPALWACIVIAVISAVAILGAVLFGWFRSRRGFSIAVSGIVVVFVLGVAAVFATWISDRISGNY